MPAAPTTDAPRPKLSVCIPTYNHERFIQGAVESVLAQTHGDFELVVSNNHSTDATSALLAQYADDPRLRIVTPPEFVPSAGNFHFAISQTRGKYFAFLSDDDRMAPEFLATLEPVLDAHPGVAFAFSGSTFVDLDGNLLRVNRQPTGPWVRSGRRMLPGIIQRMRATGDALLIRRAAYDQVGGIETEILDWEIALKLLCVGDIAYVPDPLVTLTLWDEGERKTTRKVAMLEGMNAFYDATEPFVCARYPELRGDFVRSRRQRAMRSCRLFPDLDAELRAQARVQILRMSDHPLVRARLFLSEPLGLDPAIIRASEAVQAAKEHIKQRLPGWRPPRAS